MASSVCGMTPSSAATTMTAMSVTLAPRARILVNASWPGVSRKVIGLPSCSTRQARITCVMPPASVATTLLLADLVEQRGLAVIDVAHDGDDRGPGHEVFGLVRRPCGCRACSSSASGGFLISSSQPYSRASSSASSGSMTELMLVAAAGRGRMSLKSSSPDLDADRLGERADGDRQVTTTLLLGGRVPRRCFSSAACLSRSARACVRLLALRPAAGADFSFRGPCGRPGAWRGPRGAGRGRRRRGDLLLALAASSSSSSPPVGAMPGGTAGLLSRSLMLIGPLPGTNPSGSRPTGFWTGGCTGCCFCSALGWALSGCGGLATMLKPPPMSAAAARRGTPQTAAG